MNNLAGLYYDQGKYAQADPLYTTALEVRRRILGDLHPDTLQSMSNMATLYTAQGKYAQAEQLYERTLQIRRYFKRLSRWSAAIWGRRMT